MSFDANGAAEVVPIAIGESNFKSSASQIVPQLIETFRRVQQTVSSENFPSSPDLIAHVNHSSRHR